MANSISLRGQSRESVTSHVSEFMWSWDPYGVDEDRNVNPNEYDDWVDDIVRSLFSGARYDEVHALILARVEADGLIAAPGLSEKLEAMLASLA